MDPHIHPEEPGLPKSPGNNDDGGANYLRSLKGGIEQHAAGEPSPEAGKLACRHGHSRPQA